MYQWWDLRLGYESPLEVFWVCLLCYTYIKFQIIISAFLGIAAAAYAPSAGGYPEQSNRPQAALERNAKILALDADVKEDSFRYNFETENGIKGEEQGHEVSITYLLQSYPTAPDLYSLIYKVSLCNPCNSNGWPWTK